MESLSSQLPTYGAQLDQEVTATNARLERTNCCQPKLVIHLMHHLPAGRRGHSSRQVVAKLHKPRRLANARRRVLRSDHEMSFADLSLPLSANQQCLEQAPSTVKVSGTCSVESLSSESSSPCSLQGCAYKIGACSICGKKILDTTGYKMSSK